MRIERTGADSARAVITGNELRRAGYRAKDIINGCPAVLPLIFAMAERAFPEGGKRRISVEIFPAKWGGCTFIMTRHTENRKLRKMILTAYSEEDLLEICRGLTAMGISCPESVLLGGSDHLRLIALLPEELLLKDIPFKAGLYPADDIALAKLYEHDRVLLPKNAVTLLSGSSH